MVSRVLRSRVVRSRVALAGALAAALLLTACGEDQPETAGSVVEPPFDVAATSLTDTGGEPFSLTEDTEEPLTLVFFGYTQCPDVCPLVMQTLTSGLTKLSEEEREQVQVVFVSTDPATDTPEVLRDYLDRFDPGYVGVRGDLDATVELAKSVGIFVADAEQLASGGYDLGSHGSYVVAINGDDKAPMFWRQDTSAAQFAHDVSVLLEDA
ncbi:SCO family protein [Nocardioides sp. SYSU DS0663]|uniref:SCO family protein n=1 Tax=Nocardioides sp. SYSU DS0663 TaxID=3416445 RepID=UPI003F4BD730